MADVNDIAALNVVNNLIGERPDAPQTQPSPKKPRKRVSFARLLGRDDEGEGFGDIGDFDAGAFQIPEDEIIPEDKAWYQHITQPVSEVLNKYHRDIIEPMAASLWAAGTVALPGTQVGERRARLAVQEGGLFQPWRDESKEVAEVYRSVELPKGMKGFLEIVGDPLMYIGLVSGGVGLIAKAGVAGRVVAGALKPVAMIDKVILKALALPIELPLKGISKAAGKLALASPMVAGEYAGRTAWNALRAVSGEAWIRGTKNDTKMLIEKIWNAKPEVLGPQEIIVKQSIEALGHADPESAYRLVEMLSQVSPRQAADLLKRGVAKITQANQAQAMYARYAKGKISTAVVKTFQGAYENVWGKALKPINLAMSKAILMFGMFTPMNVVEWSGRMAEQGMLPWGHAGVNTFRAKFAGVPNVMPSLFEEATTGGLVAAGLQKFGSQKNALGKALRGLDQMAFGWGRPIQAGMERYFYEGTYNTHMRDLVQAAGLHTDVVLKEAHALIKVELKKPAFRAVEKRLRADLESAVASGNPAAVLSLVDAYSIPRVRQKLVNKIIANHPTVSPAALNQLGKASPDLLATESHKVFGNMRNIEREILEYQPHIVKARMDVLIDRMPAKAFRTQGEITGEIEKIWAGQPTLGAESDMMVQAYRDMVAIGGFRSEEAQKLWNMVRRQQEDHSNAWLEQFNRGINALKRESDKQVRLGGVGIPQHALGLYRQKALAYHTRGKELIDLQTDFWTKARLEGWNVNDISHNLINNLQPLKNQTARSFERTLAEADQAINEAWLKHRPIENRVYKDRIATERKRTREAKANATEVKDKLTLRLKASRVNVKKLKEALKTQKGVSEALILEKRIWSEMPPDDIMSAAFRNLGDEPISELKDGLKSYREVLENELTEFEGVASSAREYLEVDRAASYRVQVQRRVKGSGGTLSQRTRSIRLFSVLDRYGGQFPETLTRREAEMFMQGRQLRQNVLTKDGKRVRPEFILDEISEELGYESIDAFTEALEKAWKMNREATQVTEIAADFNARLLHFQRLEGILEKSSQGLQIPKADIGMPEAGLQAGMPGVGPEFTEFRPKGKGQITQGSLDDFKKLEDWKAAAESKTRTKPKSKAELEAEGKVVESKAAQNIEDDILETLEESLKPKIDEIDAMEREFMETAANPMLTPKGQVELKALVEGVNGSLAKLPADKAKIFSELREKAVQKTNDAYSKIFIPPETRNSVDYFMQHFFPYWMYESRRWTYLPRLFARKPALNEYFFPGAGRYWQTDRGYSDVGETDWQINVFRGSILGTLARTAMKDYPPKHTGWKGEVENYIENIGRTGFYFGPIYSMPLSAILGDFGESLPAPISSPLSLAAGLGIPGAAEIQESLAPSRFREYYTNQVLAKNGIDPDTATDMERAKARQEANFAIVLMEQSAMTRYRPMARRDYYDRISEKMVEFTGVSVEEQDRLRQMGTSVYNIYSLSPEQREELNQLEGADLWQGIIQPLLPKDQQKIVVARNTFYQTLDILREDATEVQLKDDKRLQGALINGKEWRDRYHERQVLLGNSPDILKTSKVYKDVPLTNQQWTEYRERFDIPDEYVHPVQEVLNKYYEVEIGRFVDPETGGTDWSAFFDAREAAISYYPDFLKESAMEWAHRRDTPMVAEFRKAQDTLRKYWSLYDDLKKTNPEWARIIEAEERERDPIKALEIRQTVAYKSFKKMLGNSRKAIREADPQVEYYLYIFGYISNVTNPEALKLVRSNASLIPGGKQRVSFARLLGR